MLRKWLRRLLVGVTAVLMLMLLLTGVVYASSSMRFARRYEVTPEALPIPSDPASIERGRHIVVSQAKCGDCHGADLGGGTVIDDPAVGRIMAPNLTPGGVGGTLQDADWIRAIRHGVAPDGRPLIVMPSFEYARLGKGDIADVVAYLKTLPPVQKDMPPVSVGPVGRALMLAGIVEISAEVVDHAAPIPVGPPPGPTAEYGAYLVRTGCVGCHGEGLSGGSLPGTPPDWAPAANLTPSGRLGGWSEDEFFHALREGKRPDGSEIRQPMPIAATKHLKDDELRALWLYLKTVEPKEFGNH